jgi:hypothetical protein
LAVTSNAASWSRSAASNAFFNSFYPGFVALPLSEITSASLFQSLYELRRKGAVQLNELLDLYRQRDKRPFGRVIGLSTSSEDDFLLIKFSEI